MRGRCIALSPEALTLRTPEGDREHRLQRDLAPPCRLGDWLEIEGERIQVLTAGRSRELSLTRRIHDPRRRHALRVRAETESGIREFFSKRGFQEVRTPLLVPCPGMEPHIRPMRVTGTPARGERFLPTSPEFAMKKLLVGGLERIFQLCPAFRDEPPSSTHHPEFTMLEWYRAFAGYEDIQRDTEELVASLALRLHGREEIPRPGGAPIRVRPPWPRLRVRDLFAEHAGVDLVRSSTTEALGEDCRRLELAVGAPRGRHETWDDLFFKIWLDVVEPRLPSDVAVFVTRYPASQAALAVIDADPDGSCWARRFEAFAGGLELANAFEELTDPVEQRRRFEKDMALRARTYGPEFPPTPLDEEFLAALEEGMPPSGGIALGVDRLVMLLAGESEIDYSLWLPSAAW